MKLSITISDKHALLSAPCSFTDYWNCMSFKNFVFGTSMKINMILIRNASFEIFKII